MFLETAVRLACILHGAFITVTVASDRPHGRKSRPVQFLSVHSSGASRVGALAHHHTGEAIAFQPFNGNVVLVNDVTVPGEVGLIEQMAVDIKVDDQRTGLL
jgi:hypothetical protein